MSAQPELALDVVAARIVDRREALLNRWRTQVRRLPAAAQVDTPTLNNHVPRLLDDLVAALMSGHTDSVLALQLSNSPEVHGSMRLRIGFDIVEVVAEYNILRETIQSVVESDGVMMSSRTNRILNRVIDRAIAVAVDTYARERAVELQQRREEHLSFMIHDLRTPLSAMTVAREALERSLPAEARNPQVTHMLDLQRRNSERLTALLAAATQEQYNIAATTQDAIAVEPREFDLWPLAQAAIEDLRPLSDQAGVPIVNEVPQDLQVVADAQLLSHVFQNLLSNALHYTTHPGRIVVDGAPTDDGVRVSVSDTGEGIPPDRIDKVFEKLETDHTRQGGLGLGLAIVKQVVEAHGGEVSVESTLGTGTTFTFTIPNADQGARRSSAAKNPPVA